MDGQRVADAQEAMGNDDKLVALDAGSEPASPEPSKPNGPIAGAVSGIKSLSLLPVRLMARVIDHYADRNEKFAEFVEFMKQVDEAQGKQRTGLAASGAAFWLVIALFPAMIAVVNLFGLFIPPAKVATAISSLTSSVSGTVSKALTGQLQDVAAGSHRSVSIALVISLFLSIWSVSAGASSLVTAIRFSYGLRPLSWVEGKKRALAGAVIAILGIGLAALLLVAEAEFLRGKHAVVIGLISALTDIPIVIGCLALTIAGVYRLAIGKRTQWRRLTSGVAFSTGGLILLALGYGAFLAYSRERYSAVYGGVAGLVFALFLAYLAMHIVLIGAVINAQRMVNHKWWLANGDDEVEEGDGIEPSPEVRDVSSADFPGITAESSSEGQIPSARHPETGQLDGSIRDDERSS